MFNTASPLNLQSAASRAACGQEWASHDRQCHLTKLHRETLSRHLCAGYPKGTGDRFAKNSFPMVRPLRETDSRPFGHYVPLPRVPSLSRRANLTALAVTRGAFLLENTRQITQLGIQLIKTTV